MQERRGRLSHSIWVSRPIRSLCFILFTLTSSRAEVWSISKANYPYLEITDLTPGRAWSWREGFVAQRMATSQGVRINERGVQFIPYNYATIHLDARSWVRYGCEVHQDVMCKLRAVQGMENITTRVFPEQGVKVYSLVGDDSLLSVEAFKNRCTESFTGRYTSDDFRDISLCDIVSSGMDIVYLPWSGDIYVSRLDLSIVTVVVVSLVTLYVASMLATNLDIILGHGKQNTQSSIALLAIVVGTLMTIFPDVYNDPLVSFVTSNDRLGFVALIIYSVVYIICYFARDNSVYSPICPLICLLVLFSMRAFGTMDNGYVTTLAALFIVRFISKFCTKECKMDRTQNVQHALDSGLLAVLFYAGVIPQYAHVMDKVFLYAAQCVAVGVAAGALIKL